MGQIIHLMFQILLLKHTLSKSCWQRHLLSYLYPERTRETKSVTDVDLLNQDTFSRGVRDSAQVDQLVRSRLRRSVQLKSNSSDQQLFAEHHGWGLKKPTSLPFGVSVEGRVDTALCTSGDIMIPTDGYYLFIQDVKGYGRHCDVLTCSPDATTIFEYPCESVSEAEKPTYYETCMEAKCAVGELSRDYDFEW